MCRWFAEEYSCKMIPPFEEANKMSAYRAESEAEKENQTLSSQWIYNQTINILSFCFVTKAIKIIKHWAYNQLVRLSDLMFYDMTEWHHSMYVHKLSLQHIGNFSFSFRSFTHSIGIAFRVPRVHPSIRSIQFDSIQFDRSIHPHDRCVLEEWIWKMKEEEEEEEARRENWYVVCSMVAHSAAFQIARIQMTNEHKWNIYECNVVKW